MLSTAEQVEACRGVRSSMLLAPVRLVQIWEWIDHSAAVLHIPSVMRLHGPVSTLVELPSPRFTAYLQMLLVEVDFNASQRYPSRAVFSKSHYQWPLRILLQNSSVLLRSEV